MKVIYSRKGFDSGYGGFPSPIFPNGQIVSLPIPAKDGFFYSQLNNVYSGESISHVVNDLTYSERNKYSRIKLSPRHKYKQCDYTINKIEAHNDPAYYDVEHYKGYVLGQCDAAQGHLINQKVSPGDLFVFYGLFREVEKINDRWTYRDKTKKRHVIFGWLQIDYIAHVSSNSERKTITNKYSFVNNHPHIKKLGTFTSDIYSKNNCLYFSSGKGELTMFGRQLGVPSSGKVSKYNPKSHDLTSPHSVGVYPWEMPSFMGTNISYMKTVRSKSANLYSHRGPGQEFVMNLDGLSSTDRSSVIDHFKKIFM